MEITIKITVNGDLVVLPFQVMDNDDRSIISIGDSQSDASIDINLDHKNLRKLCDELTHYLSLVE